MQPPRSQRHRPAVTTSRTIDSKATFLLPENRRYAPPATTWRRYGRFTNLPIFDTTRHWGLRPRTRGLARQQDSLAGLEAALTTATIPSFKTAITGRVPTQPPSVQAFSFRRSGWTF